MNALSISKKKSWKRCDYLEMPIVAWISIMSQNCHREGTIKQIGHITAQRLQIVFTHIFWPGHDELSFLLLFRLKLHLNYRTSNRWPHGKAALRIGPAASPVARSAVDVELKNKDQEARHIHAKIWVKLWNLWPKHYRLSLWFFSNRSVLTNSTYLILLLCRSTIRPTGPKAQQLK